MPNQFPSQRVRETTQRFIKELKVKTTVPSIKTTYAWYVLLLRDIPSQALLFCFHGETYWFENVKEHLPVWPMRWLLLCESSSFVG